MNAERMRRQLARTATAGELAERERRFVEQLDRAVARASTGGPSGA